MNLQENEYTHKGFKPSLRKLQLEPRYHVTLNAFRIPHSAEPGPTLNNRHGAFWLGEFNKEGEAAVISATVFRNARFTASAYWAFGALPIEKFLERNDTARLCMEVAEFYAPSAELAIEGIQSFLTPVDQELLEKFADYAEQ